MTLLFADLCAIFTPYRWMIEHVTTKRGQLRIYLGAAPGVGKTYAMLGEAHRRLERGTDVVAAVVETHGRNKTAKLLEGIEMIRAVQLLPHGQSDRAARDRVAVAGRPS